MCRTEMSGSLDIGYTEFTQSKFQISSHLQNFSGFEAVERSSRFSFRAMLVLPFLGARREEDDWLLAGGRNGSRRLAVGLGVGRRSANLQIGLLCGSHVFSLYVSHFTRKPSAAATVRREIRRQVGGRKSSRKIAALPSCCTGRHLLLRAFLAARGRDSLNPVCTRAHLHRITNIVYAIAQAVHAYSCKPKNGYLIVRIFGAFLTRNGGNKISVLTAYY